MSDAEQCARCASVDPEGTACQLDGPDETHNLCAVCYNYLVSTFPGS